MSEISKYDDHLDSRDIQERIEELEALQEEDKSKNPDTDTDFMTESEHEELGALTKLKEEYIEYYGESSWGFGAQFINADYFEEYAEEFCKDVGYISNDLPWFISNAIDWSEVADAMQQDYTEIELDGQTFYTQEA